MLVLKDSVENVPIMSLQTGVEIATTQKAIIDPRRLTIVAFYCQGPKLDVSPAILHVDDIREASKLGFIVDSADVIMTPNDLVRLQQVLDFHFALEGKMVIEETGRKIGKVHDYTIEIPSFYITKLHVQPGMLQSFMTADVVIGRTQIIEIDDKKIVVRSATVPIAKPTHVVENPFAKHAHPQAEASRVSREDT